MSWMLILFAIAIVLSPIMWFKQSPHQKNLAETRSVARSLGIQVNLHRRPDARDSETALEVTCYKMRCSCGEESVGWTIHRFSLRGWESEWQDWRWIKQEAEQSWKEVLRKLLPHLPLGITAVIVERDSVGVIWNERAGNTELQEIARFLIELKQHMEK